MDNLKIGSKVRILFNGQLRSPNLNRVVKGLYGKVGEVKRKDPKFAATNLVVEVPHEDGLVRVRIGQGDVELVISKS